MRTVKSYNFFDDPYTEEMSDERKKEIYEIISSVGFILDSAQKDLECRTLYFAHPLTINEYNKFILSLNQCTTSIYYQKNVVLLNSGTEYFIGCKGFTTMKNISLMDNTKLKNWLISYYDYISKSVEQCKKDIIKQKIKHINKEVKE